MSRRFGDGGESRRALLRRAAVALAAPLAIRPSPGPARIAITLDLEMSRHYPRREDMHWDYEKGNLDAATKAYAVQAGAQVKKLGGMVHYFLVASALEQENVDWLFEIMRQGHLIGNHTYDHVNVLAAELKDVQFRFARAPWLVEGKSPREVIAENIRLASRAIKARLRVDPAGFRTPGGFDQGLAGREDIQKLLLEQGFDWVSSKSLAIPSIKEGLKLDQKVLEAIRGAVSRSQPFVYPTGLVEIPMSVPSDVTAMRSARWLLADFLRAIRAGIERPIELGGVYVFLGHPSCLCVEDPGFEAIELICGLVKEAGLHRARLVDLATIAKETVQTAGGRASNK